MPPSASKISPCTFSTACRTPLPPYLPASPSRNSAASCAPVEAPDGHRRASHRTALQDHIDLDRGIAAAIQDLAGQQYLQWRSWRGSLAFCAG